MKYLGLNVVFFLKLFLEMAKKIAKIHQKNYVIFPHFSEKQIQD